MNPFFWATAGGFTARTLDEPLQPGSNLLKSAAWSTLFATKPGQGLILRVLGLSASSAGSAAMGIFGSTAVGVGLGAAAGAVTGAAIGTAISSVAFGQEGKQKAIQFYTLQANNWYDYIPHYNAFKIARHYGSEIID